MKRTSFALLSVLALSGSVEIAHATPKRKPTVQEAPRSAAIAQTMGELSWGMTRDQVLEHFSAKIKEKYRPLFAKATGALEEDKLRASMRDELGKLKSSVVEFNGAKTGADVSFLRGEFTHHNGEAMLSVSENSSENYYFFIQDKLWKWYKAFDSSVFEGKSFDQFADAIQSRYGRAQRRDGEAPHGSGKHSWLEWQDESTRLRAVDNKQFYGFYCLVFEDKSTLRKLPQLRTVRPPEQPAGNALVESVTRGGESDGDQNPDVVDHITGKRRRRHEASATPGKSEPSRAPDKVQPAPSESGGVSAEDDPLKGLGL